MQNIYIVFAGTFIFGGIVWAITCDKLVDKKKLLEAFISMLFSILSFSLVINILIKDLLGL